MQKRKALAAAGAVTVTALAATVALGTNLGLFGLANDPVGPGNFGPVGEAPAKAAPVVATERTEVVDVRVPYYVSDGSTDPAGGGPAPVPGVAAAAPSANSGGGSSGGGGGGSSSAASGAASTPSPTSASEPSLEHSETPETPETPETHEPETHEPETKAPGADD